MTMTTLGITHSACETCRRLVPAKVFSDGRDVFFRAFCPEHGESVRLVRRDVEDYLRTLRIVKPAWTPREFQGNAQAPCPEGCGMCARHEQHLCMPIVEITSRCDLACPICIASAGRTWDMGVEEFSRLLDVTLRAEGQIDVLNLSGGEPLLHPRLLELIDEALRRREVVRVSLSTNGLRLLKDESLLAALVKRNVCLSLQFDGFSQEPYRALRGQPLLDEKRRLLDLLERHDAPTTLTMTAAKGVNDGEFRPMLDYFFAHEHVLSLMIQPLAFAGRAAGWRHAQRMTIPDVVRALGGAGHPAVSAADFIPLPCSHPLCFSLAFYLMTPQGPVSVHRLVEAREVMDLLRNRLFCGLAPEEFETLRDLVYRLWSGPTATAPDTQAAIGAIHELLRRTSCCRFDARQFFQSTERRLKSIFIHAFQDAETFDLARVRRCCDAYPQADGRMVPACVHNVMGRRQ